MKRTIVYGIVLVTFICCYLLSYSTDREKINTAPVKAKKGTYQFIVSDDDSTSVFTDDILVVIESMRDPQKTVYYQVSSTVKVKILSLVLIHRCFI